MDYLSIFLAGAMLGLFAGAMVLVVILAHPGRPGWQSNGYQPLAMPGPVPAPPGPKVAQMPVHEAGIVAYQFLGVTGEEQA
jgi:hypothetical protein